MTKEKRRELRKKLEKLVTSDENLDTVVDGILALLAELIEEMPITP